jgi:predicted Mrr-cat superfamily restriction endonuclease
VTLLLPLNKNLNVMAVGKIVGEYEYEHLHSEIEQYRPVHWLKKEVGK